jgi:hypothetical protein
MDGLQCYTDPVTPQGRCRRYSTISSRGHPNRDNRAATGCRAHSARSTASSVRSGEWIDSFCSAMVEFARVVKYLL